MVHGGMVAHMIENKFASILKMCLTSSTKCGFQLFCSVNLHYLNMLFSTQFVPDQIQQDMSHYGQGHLSYL